MIADEFNECTVNQIVKEGLRAKMDPRNLNDD
jgi:hypothetical protein